jgi:hypothetical protein
MRSGKASFGVCAGFVAVLTYFARTRVRSILCGLESCGMARGSTPSKTQTKTQVLAGVIRRCAAMGFSVSMIAETVGVSERTLQKNKAYRKALQEGRAEGRQQIAAKLYSLAMRGNVPALIFLSKQLLGFSDRVTHEQTVEVVEEVVLAGEEANRQITAVPVSVFEKQCTGDSVHRGPGGGQDVDRSLPDSQASGPDAGGVSGMCPDVPDVA